MNYDLIYTSIIQNRKSNPVTGYTENHHILPKCLFPQFKNLKEHSWNSVNLSAREHFICHQLLVKIYSGKLIHAAFMMSGFKRYGSKQYSWLKELHANKMRLLMFGKNKGKTYEEIMGLEKSIITKEKISLANKGKKHSEETKQKMSDIVVSKETREKCL
jgi:hypothetical protein